MRRALVVLGLLLSLLLAGTPARAITGNFVPDFEHEYVGLIVFYDANGEFLWRCSGSLLTDRVFLTAGHCTDQDAEESPVSARIYFEQDAGANYDPVTEIDPVTGYPETGGITAHTLYDYGFDNFAGFPEIHDVGLVILDAPVQTVYPIIDTYASLAAAGTLDTYGTGQDATVTISGYGGQPDQPGAVRVLPQPADGHHLHPEPRQPQRRWLQRAAGQQSRWRARWDLFRGFWWPDPCWTTPT
jgi:hypothetical protein